MQGDNVRASMVIGRKNGTATLPCSFSPSIRNPSPITIRWMKGSSREESTVFNHSVNPPYNVPIKGGGRYELVGKLDQGDASIRVKELRLNDSSDYFCHVWVMNSTQETVTQDETKLEVVVPSTILELFVESDNGTGEHTLVCRAEGKPPANITWIGPGNSALNSSEMRVTHDPEKLLTVGELLHPRMPGKYTCVAVNEHQRDTREIHLFEDGLRALAIRAAIYAVYFLMIGFTFCWLKRGERHHLSSNAGVNRSDAAPPSGSVRFR
ncbi:sialic acid-binding Ig-like lectin 15 [Rhinoraja longicauda]